jgi:hypothetical protein
MNAKRLIQSINSAIGSDIREISRKREIVYARFVFFHKMYNGNKNISLAKVGSFVSKDHASVLHGLRQFELLKDYYDFKEILYKIENELDKRWVCEFTELKQSDFKIRKYNETSI